MMHKAIMGMSELDERYEMVFYVVECKSIEDVILAAVPILPYILVKEQGGEWKLYSRTITVTAFIKAVEELGR